MPLLEVAGFQVFRPGRIWVFANKRRAGRPLGYFGAQGFALVLWCMSVLLPLVSW